MIRHIFTFVVKTGLLGLFLFVGSAAVADISAGTNDPKLLFERMLEAQSKVAFTGSIAFERGSKLTSFFIESQHRDSGSPQIIETLTGPQEIFHVPPRNSCNSAERLSQGFYSQSYNFSFVGKTRVAGRQGYEILLRPVDPYRLGYSFVIDQETGLMLKSVAMSPNRNPLERIQFVNIDILPSISDQLVGKFQTVNAEKTECMTQDQDLQMQLSWVPDGFRQFKYDQVDGEMRYLFSDGLSKFSLFVEPIDEITIPTGSGQQGATSIIVNYIVVKGVTYLVTFVGEVPMESGARVLSNLSVQL